MDGGLPFPVLLHVACTAFTGLGAGSTGWRYRGEMLEGDAPAQEDKHDKEGYPPQVDRGVAMLWHCCFLLFGCSLSYRLRRFEHEEEWDDSAQSIVCRSGIRRRVSL